MANLNGYGLNKQSFQISKAKPRNYGEINDYSEILHQCFIIDKATSQKIRNSGAQYYQPKESNFHFQRHTKTADHTVQKHTEYIPRQTIFSIIKLGHVYFKSGKIQSMFSNYSDIKLELNNRKETEIYPKT